MKRLGKAGRHQAQIRTRAVGPLVAQREAVGAPDVDGVQGAGHRVESGRHDDDVDVVRDPVLGTDPALGHPVDRPLGEVDQGDVVLVEHLEVAGVDAHPLAGDRVRARGEPLGEFGALHLLADPGADVLGDGLVGLRVPQQVAEAATEAQAADVPAAVQLPYDFLLFGLDQEHLRLFVAVEALR